MIKVKVIVDLDLFGRKYYAGQIIEIAETVYDLVKDKVEKVN